MIDSHAHLYLKEFDSDRDLVIKRAKDVGVSKIILPNIDSSTIIRMNNLEKMYPDFCFSTIGLHPTSVNANFEDELNIVRLELEKRDYIAVGEIGIDLYWDKTYEKEQIYCFQKQIEWALEFDKPIIIHLRNSHEVIMKALEPYKGSGLKGVFHSFTGNNDELNEIMNFGGFLVGINGIVTFKNSELKSVIKEIDINKLFLETDSPYLAPVPMRGKRNESSYIKYIAEEISKLKNIELDELLITTNYNCKNLFRL